MKDDRQLLLYIVGKVARLDAITSSIHSMLFEDLAPAGKREAKLRAQAIQLIFNSNIQSERAHLQNQFPADFKIIDEYISLGEREMIDQIDGWLRKIMEGPKDE